MSSPLCRCRVLYIGAAVPTLTKDGLHGIQQPLHARYHTHGKETRGVDAWLSVWSNGVTITPEGANEKPTTGESQDVQRSSSTFYPIVGLHYCAAVRYDSGDAHSPHSPHPSNPHDVRFVPLDSLAGRATDGAAHPPIFAAIFRRTTGVKLLECHAFICTDERAANALVRCCFHAYAASICLKMENSPRARALRGGEGGSMTSPADSPSSGEQQTSEQLTSDDIDIDDFEHRATIGTRTWQRRAGGAATADPTTNGDYDLTDSASDVNKKTTLKRNKKRDTQSESHAFDNHVMVPYGFPQPPRRSGSHADMHTIRPRPDVFEPHFGDPNAQPPPPPHFASHAFMPPPFMMMPPSPFGLHPHAPSPPHHHPHHRAPPFFAAYPPHFAPTPPPPPHAGRYRATSMPPMFSRYGFPPPFMPPPPHHHPHFMPPHFMPPPSHFAHSPRPSEGPIIEYDTFQAPRRSGGHDEPIYSSSTLPHSAAYRVDDAYDTYKQRSPRTTKLSAATAAAAAGVHSDSDATSVNDSLWQAYESDAYRSPTAATRVAHSPALAKSHGTRSKPSSAAAPVARPITPPADYEQHDAATAPPAGRPAAVF